MLILTTTVTVGADDINYSRDIQPILSNNCFACHGFDPKTREADLRLDTRDGALRDLDGYSAIVPGDPAKSELMARILTDDDDEIMPPPKSKKTLTKEQKDLLQRWIKSGAEYTGHWAYTPPKAPQVPKSGLARWPANTIDHFVLRKLKKNDLKPAKEADRGTLVRRVAFDLTGLPPTPAEIDAFVKDRSADAYEKMVDRYLGSEAYGEHMARYWLDLARYADTNGYQYDKERTQWPWRDWVIHAYNSNMPFDQFTIEQLAGDRLEKPTTEQLVATGFNRNHPITIEGGIIDEEYRVEYVMDRVVTTTQTWMALSFGCARCHDHKYDPISQDEFYQTFSFFNNVADKGMSGFSPQLSVQSPEGKRQTAEMDTKLATMRKEAVPTDAEVKQWIASVTDVKADWKPLTADTRTFTALKTTPTSESVKVTLAPQNSTASAGRFVRVSLKGNKRYLGLAEVQVYSDGKNIAKGKKAMQSSTGFGGPPQFAVDGNTDGVYAKKSITHTNEQKDPWWEVDLGTTAVVNKIAIWNRTDCCQERLEGFTLEILDEKRKVVWSRVDQPAPQQTVSFDTGGPISIQVVRNGDHWLSTERVVIPSTHSLQITAGDGTTLTTQTSNADAWLELAALPKALAASLKNPNAAQIKKLGEHMMATSPSQQANRDAIAKLQVQRDKIANQPAAKMLIMKDLAKPRKAFFLERGQYDQRKHEVQAGVPAVLGGMTADLPKDRLGFAKWLVAPSHPLTARVAVNRYWQRLFGVGIVKSLEEFGIQGEWPSHPELLDWLAVEFINSGWDVKAIQRLMITSATYRQSSVYTGKSAELDPENRLLARASRFRLDAEVIRDTALAVSGLLEHQVGGPSVYPYQPAGLWMEINNRPGYSRTYPKPAADQLYRRSMYTFWKRTLPHPQMQTFDAPNREFCTATRSKTNTPLQALALMHDPQYVEAARHLAQRMIKEGGKTASERLDLGFRLVTARAPSKAETALINGLIANEQARFKASPESAESALSVGLSPRDTSLDPVEHAVWLTVARLLLNLDEAINRN
jgi:hypothetical protein